MRDFNEGFLKLHIGGGSVKANPACENRELVQSTGLVEVKPGCNHVINKRSSGLQASGFRGFRFQISPSSFFLLWSLELSDKKSMGLKYEPSSEPLHNSQFRS